MREFQFTKKDDANVQISVMVDIIDPQTQLFTIMDIRGGRNNVCYFSKYFPWNIGAVLHRSDIEGWYKNFSGMFIGMEYGDINGAKRMEGDTPTPVFVNPWKSCNFRMKYEEETGIELDAHTPMYQKVFIEGINFAVGDIMLGCKSEELINDIIINKATINGVEYNVSDFDGNFSPGTVIIQKEIEIFANLLISKNIFEVNNETINENGFSLYDYCSLMEMYIIPHEGETLSGELNFELDMYDYGKMNFTISEIDYPDGIYNRGKWNDEGYNVEFMCVGFEDVQYSYNNGVEEISGDAEESEIGLGFDAIFTSLGEYTVNISATKDGEPYSESIVIEVKPDVGINDISDENGDIRLGFNNSTYIQDTVRYYKVDDGEWVLLELDQESDTTLIILENMWGEHVISVKAIVDEVENIVEKNINLTPIVPIFSVFPESDNAKIVFTDFSENEDIQTQIKMNGGEWQNVEKETFGDMQIPCVDIPYNSTTNIAVRNVITGTNPLVKSEEYSETVELKPVDEDKRFLTFTAIENSDLCIIGGDEESQSVGRIIQKSVDGVNWNNLEYTVQEVEIWGRTENMLACKISLLQGEKIYIRGFENVRSTENDIYFSSNNKISVSGSYDALISPINNFVKFYYTNIISEPIINLGFIGMLDCENLKLSYLYRNFYSGFFAENQGTEYFENFTPILPLGRRNYRYSYGFIFENSSIKNVDKLPIYSGYREAFYKSELQQMPRIGKEGDIIRITGNELRSNHLYEGMFHHCTFPMSTDGGQTIDFGPNNFILTEGLSPKEFAIYLGNVTGFGFVVDPANDNVNMINGEEEDNLEGYYFDIQTNIQASFNGDISTFVSWSISKDGGNTWNVISTEQQLDYNYQQDAINNPYIILRADVQE